MKALVRIKNSDIYETLIHSKNYLLTLFATTGLSLITIPIFTKLLSLEEYGMVALYLTYLALIIPIFTLNTSSSISRYYYEERDDFKEFLGSTLLILFVVYFSFIILLIPFTKIIFDFINFPTLLIILLMIHLMLNVFKSIYIQILVPQKKSKEVTKINIISAYIRVGLSVILVLNLEQDKYYGQIFGNFIVAAIFGSYFLYKIIKMSKFTINKSHLKYIVNYSVPMIPYVMSGVILAQVDRIMIGQFVDLDSVGVYSLGYTIGALLLMVISSVNTALTPDFFKFYKAKEFYRLDILTKRLFSLFAVIALGLIYFIDEVFFILVEEKFHVAKEIVPVVSIGFLCYSLFFFYGRYVGYEKKTYFLSIILLTAGVINIILNYLFIPQYGIIASAYTTAISYFLLAVMAWVVSKFFIKSNSTPVSYFVFPFVLISVFIVIYQFWLKALVLSPILLFLIKGILIIIFAILLYNQELRKLIRER